MSEDVARYTQVENNRGNAYTNPEAAMRDRLMQLKDLLLWDRIMSERWTGQVEVVDVRIKETPDGQDPYLIMVKGYDAEGTPVIAFHSGGTVLEGLASCARRLKAGQMKWRPDEYRIKAHGS